MRADFADVVADYGSTMSDRETVLAEVLKSLCDSVQLCLNARLRSPSAVITVGEARRLQSLFDLSSHFQELLEDITNNTDLTKIN